MNRPTLEEVIAALPYWSLQDRGRLRFALAQPILPPKEPEPEPSSPVQKLKTLRIREPQPPGAGQ